MTPSPEARPTDGGNGLSEYAGRRGAYPTWPRVGVVLVLLGLTFFVAKSCQNNQIKLTQDAAIELAKKQIDFTPQNTQIRLLRQGLERRPFWVVSLSIPAGDEPNPSTFKRLALVRIDATSGDVASVQEQEPQKRGNAQTHAGSNQKEP